MNNSKHRALCAVDAGLAPDDGVFELPGAQPAWIWAHTCPTPNCDCRTALIMATHEGRDVLLERGAAVRAAWNTKRGDYADVAAKIEDLLVFSIEIDSAEVVAPDRTGPDLTPPAHIADISTRLDGETLDAIGYLWYRGKHLPDPTQLTLQAPEIRIKGWRRGDMLARDDLGLDVRNDVYILDDGVFAAVEMYCPVPDCACGEVVVHFDACADAPSPGHVEVQPSGAARLVPEGKGHERLVRLWTAFKRRHPQHLARFAQRYPVMKTLGARMASAPTAPLIAPPKVGRNDACPCGSGKKYKKCCAAQ